MGYVQTKMVWNKKEGRLEIVDNEKNRILAFVYNSFPIGIHHWNFTDKECRDSNTSQSRKMNFHLAVDQPGYFCCNTGVCIESTFKCDRVPHCEDRSDEIGCTVVQKHKNYDAAIPPIREMKTNQGVSFPNVDVEASITVREIFDIDEKESKISILFNVSLLWVDHFLKFKFLKEDEFKNVLTEKAYREIWMPSIKWSILKGGLTPKQSFGNLNKYAEHAKK